MISNFTIKNRNYQILYNINNISDMNQNILVDIEKIITEKNMDIIVKNIMNMHNKMNSLNEYSIKYIMNQNKKPIKIFGKKFIENNINNFDLMIGDITYKLVEYFEFYK